MIAAGPAYPPQPNMYGMPPGMAPGMPPQGMPPQGMAPPQPGFPPQGGFYGQM